MGVGAGWNTRDYAECFLAWHGAACVTGQNLIVDGGWTVW
jgi:hypothetical protein